jgi:hypothetical protein
MKKTIAVLAVLLCFSGCENKISRGDLQQADSGRVKVVSLQTLVVNADSHAIIVVVDTKTGKEYLAIQSFGVVEIVFNGKVMVEK